MPGRRRRVAGRALACATAAATAILSLFSACGEGVVRIDQSTYKPKIVIQGFLRPMQKVDHIYISRNFPINSTIDRDALPLKDADVSITEVTSGQRYPLVFNADSAYFEYPGNDWRIAYNTGYRLQVTARIDGAQLSASSVTTTPQPGFEILEDYSQDDSLTYRERDAQGELKLFYFVFKRSPDVNFYPASILALDADTSTFIYSPVNPYLDFDAAKVLENFDRLRTSLTWIQDTPPEYGVSAIVLGWFHFQFYGRYRVIIYAGDQNYKDFFLTHNQVQDVDGSLREPVFHIDGDGIGVFASVLADTAVIKVLPPKR